MNTYIKSALITFCAGVAIVVIPELDSLSLEAVENGALVGLMFAGVRTGIKLVLEMFIAWYASQK